MVSWPLSETAWQLQATTNLVTAGSIWTEYSYQTNGATCYRISPARRQQVLPPAETLSSNPSPRHSQAKAGQPSSNTQDDESELEIRKTDGLDRGGDCGAGVHWHKSGPRFACIDEDQM